MDRQFRIGQFLMVLSTVLRRLALFTAMLLSGGHLFYPRIGLLAVFIALVTLLPQSSFRRVHRAIVPVIILIFIVLFLEAFRIESGIGRVFIRGANFFVAVLLLNLYMLQGMDVFREDFYYITRIFVFQTIATVVIFLILPGVFSAHPGTGVKTFHYILYYHSTVSGGMGLVRPDGFFWEPGILQIYLNLSLFLSIWIFRSNAIVILTAIAIFLTQSTTGVLILTFQIFAYLSYTSFSGSGSYKILRTFLLVPLAIPLYPLAQDALNEKMNGELRGSFYARNYDAFAGWDLALENPLLGIGFDPQSYLKKTSIYDVQLEEYSADAFNQVRGNTNGIIIIFYSLGFPLGAFFIAGIFTQTAIKSTIIVPVLLFISLLSEPTTLTPIFLFFIFSGVAQLFGRRATDRRKSSEMTEIQN